MNDINNDKNWQEARYFKDENLRTLLENRAKTLKPMIKFKLSNCNFSSINLVNNRSKEGYILKDCDLYKSDFQKAHCYKIDFSGSNLMKADFSFANLNSANLIDCNLLGTNFKHAKLENIRWGKKILQEKEAKRTKNKEESKILYQEAEEIYRYLRKITEDDGLVDTAGFFFQKEMQMRRRKMPLFSLQRIISKLVDLSCGYGEKPTRIILVSLFIILCFAGVFFFTGLLSDETVIVYASQASLSTNIDMYWQSLYFSVVTFTTLGYGDILPLGISRLFASIEALLGGFILALFVVVFVKKMTR